MSKFTGFMMVGALVASSWVGFAQDKKDEPKEPKLPKSVELLLESCEKDALSSYQVYQKSLSETFQKTEKALNKELENILKSNSSTKLEDAVMVKEKIATFKKEISEKMEEVGKEGEKKESDKKNKKSKVFTDLVGIWDASCDTGWNGQLRFNDDGTCKCGSYNGTWEIKNNKVICSFENKNVDTYSLPIVKNELKGNTSSGRNLTAKKQL